MSFTWGTVTGTSPLRVKLDGDTTAVPFSPDSLVDPRELVTGERVRCELSRNRLIIHGRSAGQSVPTGTYLYGVWRVAPAGFLKADGSGYAAAAYPALFEALNPVVGQPTIDLDADTLTIADSGLVDGDPIYLTTTGELPTGLAENTVYYVRDVSGDGFALATTAGGTKIAVSGSQSGTHTARFCPYGISSDGSTFYVPDMGDYVSVGQRDGSAEFGSVGRVYGEKKHTLSYDEMPSHSHRQTFNTGQIAPGGGGQVGGMTGSGGSAPALAEQITTAAGNGQSHNNIQPSRTALAVIKT